MGRRRRKDRHLPPRVYLRHGAYYYVRDGRWTRLGPASDYQAVLHAYAEIEASPPHRVRVGELVSRYLAAAKIAPETRRGYEASARRLEILGDILAGELDRPTVFRYVTERGTVSANRDRALLSAAYNWGQNIGLVSHNPAQGLARRNPERPRTRYLTDAELTSILAHADRRFALLCLFAWLTGARQGDVVRVTVGDCGAEGVRIGGRKTGEAVTVQYSPTLAEVCRIAASSRTVSDPLFLNTRGKPWTESAVRQAWDEARRKAGIGDARFHDLRRKAGTELDLSAAQALLGHTDSRITRRHYHHKRTARAAR